MWSQLNPHCTALWLPGANWGHWDCSSGWDGGVSCTSALLGGGGNDIVTTGRHRGTRCSSCKGLWGLGVCTEHLQSVSSIGTLLSSSLFSITHPEQ